MHKFVFFKKNLKNEKWVNGAPGAPGAPGAQGLGCSAPIPLLARPWRPPPRIGVMCSCGVQLKDGKMRMVLRMKAQFVLEVWPQFTF